MFVGDFGSGHKLRWENCLASHSDRKWATSWSSVEYLPILSQLFAGKNMTKNITKGLETSRNLNTFHWNPFCCQNLMESVMITLIFTKHGTRICSWLGSTTCAARLALPRRNSNRTYIDHWSSLILFRHFMLGRSSCLTILEGANFRWVQENTIVNHEI